MIRLLLASIASKRGLPGSSRNQALRKMQEGEAAHSTHRELSRVLIVRLQKLPRNDSFDSTEAMLGAITSQEAGRFGVVAGQTIPDALVAKVLRSLKAPLKELIDCGAISSGAMLVDVLPQLDPTINIPLLDHKAFCRLVRENSFSLGAL